MELPPLQVTRAVIQRYARLLDRYKSDLGERPLALPNGEFFPDKFNGDAESVGRLAWRMQGHAGMADIPISCQVITPDIEAKKQSSCGSGACGVPETGAGIDRLVDNGDGWLLQVPAPELKHPVALTTNLARSLAFVFLVETQKEDEVLEPPVDVTADLVAVALGFGALMLQGSYIYAKSCGGPQIGSVTTVGTTELAITVSLFAELGDHKIAPALKVLGVTQREALSEASRLVKSNRKLVERIKRNPAAVARDDFKLAQRGAFLSGLVKKFNKKSPAEADLNNPDLDLEDLESLIMAMPPSSRAGRPKSTPPPPDPGREELKSLVADALNDSGA